MGPRRYDRDDEVRMTRKATRCSGVSHEKQRDRSFSSARLVVFVVKYIRSLLILFVAWPFVPRSAENMENGKLCLFYSVTNTISSSMPGGAAFLLLNSTFTTRLYCSLLSLFTAEGPWFTGLDNLWQTFVLIGTLIDRFSKHLCMVDASLKKKKIFLRTLVPTL